MKYTLLIIPFLFIACTEEEEKPEQDFQWTKENSIEFGQGVAAQEEIDIKLFLEMHKDWKMHKTGSGLQYYIYERTGDDTTFHPKPGQWAHIEYEVTLLSGEECYKTADDEYEKVKVDNSEIETGVQEAVKLMVPGDRAKLIIPSHLGHGVAGDLDKIPPLTTLVMDIHLIGVSER